MTDKTEEREQRKDRWEMQMYKQGSEACRNYSQLTMRTRTLSQEVLLVSVVGLSAVITKVDASAWPQIVLAAGVALLPFSVSLAFVDWHYQSAFSAIRNSLADIEEGHHQDGPWRAHLKERTHFKDHIASYGPFLLLSAIGCLAIMVGIWRLAEETNLKITAGQFYPAMFTAQLVAVWLFWVSFYKEADGLDKLVKDSRPDRCFLNVVRWINTNAYWGWSLPLIAISIVLGLLFPKRWLMCVHVLFLLLLWVCFFLLMCWLAATKDRGRSNQTSDIERVGTEESQNTDRMTTEMDQQPRPPVSRVGVEIKYAFFQENLILSREEAVTMLAANASGQYQAIWHDSPEVERVRNEVEIVITLEHEVGEKNLDRWPNLKMVSMGFTGYDKVDMDYCRSRGLKLYYVPDYSTDSVAELTIGLTLAVLRKIRLADQDVREGRWDRNSDAVPGIELRGKKVGILGTGKIGSASAKLFQAFDCEVTGWSRSHREVDLHKIFAESDILVLHLPASDETKHIVGAEQLALMKRTSVLINTARSELVDTAALVSALAERRILGAGIDVLDEEGPIPPEQRSSLANSFLALPNLVVTPHVGFKTQEALRRLATTVIENIARFLSDSPENRLELE